MVSDAEYDRLEDGLRAWEGMNKSLRHPNSPTGYCGSDQPLTYPRSVRRFGDNQFGIGYGNYSQKPRCGRSLADYNRINREVIGCDLVVEQVKMLLHSGDIDSKGAPA